MEGRWQAGEINKSIKTIYYLYMWVSYLLANKLETMCGYFPISHTLTDTTTHTHIQLNV